MVLRLTLRRNLAKPHIYSIIYSTSHSLLHLWQYISLMLIKDAIGKIMQSHKKATNKPVFPGLKGYFIQHLSIILNLLQSSFGRIYTICILCFSLRLFWVTTKGLILNCQSTVSVDLNNTIILQDFGQPNYSCYGTLSIQSFKLFLKN